MQKKLFAILNQYTTLTDEDKSALEGIIKIKSLQVGEFWYYEGLYAKNIAFISEGYLRKYFVVDGVEKTDFFYFENSFTGDLPSILENRPCKSYNVAMEPTTLLSIPYSELYKIAEDSKNFERLLRIFAEQGFVTYYNRTTSFILKSPKERYLELIEKQPQIIQRAKQYHIASYLGITPQHLSRIRASLVS